MTDFFEKILSNGELQKEITELKADNKRLKVEIYGLNQELLGYKKGVQASEIIELKQTLQEIKEIAKELLEKGLEPQSVEHQLRLRGKRELASIILDLIAKAEEEWNT